MKVKILAYLAGVTDATAADVAEVLGATMPTAGMALLRLVRGGLASRAWDPGRRAYFYAVTSRGQARLNFLSARRP